MKSPSLADEHRLLERVVQAKRANAWREIVDVAGDVVPGSEVSDRIADVVVFALSQLGRRADALALNDLLLAQRATTMRVSSKAWLLYDALLSGEGLPGLRRSELDRRFLEAIEAHIAAERFPVVPHYRRGLYFAEVCGAQDRRALADFTMAIATYDGMSISDKLERHALEKPWIKSLYAGARCALRLREATLSRALAARCLKADAGRDHIAPVFKLYAAAEACAGCGDSARAERGLRMALEAEGPPDRAFISAALARVVAAQGRLDDAIAWIEQVRVERRPPWIWRRLGELHLRANHVDEAIRCLRTALHRDRHGRHRTLILLGQIYLSRGEHGHARGVFLEALRLRRKRDQVVDEEARRGLQRVLAARGEPSSAHDVKVLLGHLDAEPIADRPSSRTDDTAREGQLPHATPARPQPRTIRRPR